MVEKSDVVEECSSCGRLKQEIEIARKDQAATLKMIKGKIMSTDKLIKKYQRKCDEFDKQAKLLNDVTTKHENCQRNIEILQEQLNHSLEVTEPQKKNIKRLIQEKFIAEEKIQEMKKGHIDLEEVIHQLKHTNNLRDEKDSSWKLEQQQQAKQIEKEKKRIEKLTKDLEKAKEEIKKGRGLVREKTRELRAFGRKCDHLEFQLKKWKEELKRAKVGSKNGDFYQTKRKSSPMEVNRSRRSQQSGKYCEQKLAELVNESPDEHNIASDEQPSVTSIFDEMTELAFHPVLSPVPPSTTCTDEESKQSSNESSDDEHSCNSNDSSSKRSFGDLGEMLEMSLRGKDADASDEAGTTDGLDFAMEEHGHLESNRTDDEEVGNNLKLVHFASEDNISNDSAQIIIEKGRKENTLDTDLETENRTSEKEQCKKNVAEEDVTASDLQLEDCNKANSSCIDSTITSSKVLLSVATCGALSEVNTKTKTKTSVGSDNKTAKEVDIQNNNLSSLKKDFIDTVLLTIQLENHPMKRDDQKNGVVHVSASMDRVKRDDLVMEESVKCGMHLDKPEMTIDDDSESAALLREADKQVNPSEETPCTEHPLQVGKDLLTDDEITWTDLGCVDTLLQNELDVDSRKEDASRELSWPVTKLNKITKTDDNDVQEKCSLTMTDDNDVQEKCSLTMTDDEADSSLSKTKIMNDSPKKLYETTNNTLQEKHKHKVVPERDLTNELYTGNCLLEKNLDSERDASSRKENTEQYSHKTVSNACVQQSCERTSKSNQSLRSQNLLCESTIFSETDFSKRRIAHCPKEESEISSNTSTLNYTKTEETLLDKTETPKQKDTEFGDKSLLNKSGPSECDENQYLEVSEPGDNALKLNEGGFGVRKARKSKRCPSGFYDIGARKKQRRIGSVSSDTIMPIRMKRNSARAKTKSKTTETTRSNTQKQLDSKFNAETSENDINENNTSTCKGNLDGVCANDKEQQKSAATCSLIPSMNDTDDDIDSAFNNTNELLNHEEESIVSEKSSVKSVVTKVRVYGNSTNSISKDNNTSQYFDDTSVDKTDTIMDRSTEEVVNEGGIGVVDDAVEASSSLIKQAILNSTKQVNLSSDCEGIARNSETREDDISVFKLGGPEVPQDLTHIDVVTSNMQNTYELNIDDYELNIDDYKKVEPLTSDGASDSNNINKPVDDNNGNDFTAIKETTSKSDNVHSTIPIDSLPSISSIINDHLNVFERMPFLTPLPYSPNSSCELSRTRDCDMRDGPSRPPITSLPTPSSAPSNKSSGVTSSGCNRVSLLRSVSQPSWTAKGHRAWPECEELETLRESDMPKQQACDTEDSSPNKEQVEELASNKQKKKKSSLKLSVRPSFFSEIKYALKVLKFLTVEGIKMDDVIDRLSSPRNMSNGTPLAATLVKFPRNKDLMPIIIQRYHERDRQNLDQKSRLAHLNHWKPVLSVFEERVLEMVTRLSKVDHFKGLSTKIISLLSRSILHFCKGVEDADKICVASNCRLLCALCRKECNLQRMRVLCYDIIRSLHCKPGTVLYLMISISAVWPTVLSSSASTWATPRGLVWIGGESFQPLQCTIQMVLTTWARSNEWVLLGNVIDWLCAWKQVPSGVLSLQRLAEELVRLMKDPSFAHLMPGKGEIPILGFDLYEVVKALEMVTCVLGWAWLNNILVRGFIWDILTSWTNGARPVTSNAEAGPPCQNDASCDGAGKSAIPSLVSMQCTSGEQKEDIEGVTHDGGTGSSTCALPITEDTSKHCCEATVVAAIRLLGLVCGITIQQYQKSIPQVMPLLIGVLERAQHCQVPYAVQLASSYSLLEVSPWQPRKVASVLEKWKQDQISLPESLIQGLNTLKLCLHSCRDADIADQVHQDIDKDLMDS